MPSQDGVGGACGAEVVVAREEGRGGEERLQAGNGLKEDTMAFCDFVQS